MKTRGISAIGAAALLLAAVLLAAAPAWATTIIAASTNNSAPYDTNSDDLGNAVQTIGGPFTAVGERNGGPIPPNDELRYWIPFSLSAAERAAIGSAPLVLLETHLDEKKNTSGLSVDVIGLSGRTSTTAVVTDYQAAGTTVADNAFISLTPTGWRALDVTSFAQAEAATPGSVLAFRAEIDPAATIPNADAVRNNYIFGSQQNTNASRRPVLAVLPAGTPRIVDPFENGDIATGGLNGGFQLFTNSAGGSGSVTEAGSHATLSATGGGNDNSGIVSLNTFDPDAGFTAVWSVTRTQTPAANGLNLLLMAEPGFMNTTGQPNLAFRFEGDGDFSLRGRISGADAVLASDSFNVGSFNDGFTVVGTFNPAGWEYTIVGLLGMANPVASGAWTLSRNFDTLFDATTHMAAFIQTDSGDRTMNIDLMAVYTTPEPGTLALLALGGLGLLRRRRRGRSKGASVAVLLALCLLAAPAVEAGVYSDWVVDHDPVAYWRLNETAFGAPDDALDASGNGHHGDYTNTGAIALAQPGPRPTNGFIGLEVGNNAASFAGAGSGRVDLDHGFLPTGASQRTIMGWFNGGNTNQQYFNYGTNAAGQRVSVTASDSTVAVAVNSHNYGITGLGLLAGWHHLAIVKPAGATSSDSWQFYIDGVDRTAEATTLAGSARTINTVDGVATPRWIGQNQGGPIDEVAVFDRALTSDTIEQAYNAAAQANTRQVLADPVYQTVDRNNAAPATSAAWAGSGTFFIRERSNSTNPEQEARLFFQFDLTDLGTWPIHGALLKLHEFNKLNSVNSEDMGLAVVDAPWTPGSNDPLWNQAIVSRSEINIGTNGPASAGPAVSIDFYIDVTDILLAWQADPSSNHGFRLRFLNDNFVGAAFDLTGPDGVQLIVLQHVPEPGTLALLALGGLGLLRRRAAGLAR